MSNLLSGLAIWLVIMASLVVVHSAHAAEGGAQRLQAGDRLAIKVFEEEQISGSYLIDSSGTITLPIVGGIQVGGQTLEEAQKTIETVLSQGYYTKPVVSVRVEEFRPVFVHGQVKAPGAYPYRTGLTPIGAVVLAGGAPNALTSALSATTDLVAAEERVNIQQQKKLEFLVRIAALEAVRDDKDKIALTALPAEARAQRGVEDLLKSEQKQLDTEVAGLKNEVAVLEKQRPQFKAELDAIETELAAQTKLLGLFNERAKDIEGLRQRGLSRSAAALEPAQQKAIAETAIARLRSSKSRNEIERTATELKIVEKQNIFKQKALQQLADARRGLADVSIQLLHALKVRELRRQAAGLGSTPGSPMSFVILRMIDGKQRSIEATASTPLEPGDIVEVRNFETPNAVGIGGEGADAAIGTGRIAPIKPQSLLVPGLTEERAVLTTLAWNEVSK